MEIKAPNDYSKSPRPWVFLAGSIEMGTAENWQETAAKAFPDITILNPRRDDWDSSWEQSISNPKFREQVEWELKSMELCDEIIMYFDPKTFAPISLLELGLNARNKKMTVICPDGFYRKGNIEIVCHRYNIPLFNSLKDLKL